MAEQKQDDQHEHTFSNYVRIRDVVQKTCLGRWTIGRSGERGSGVSVISARHDDDDDDISFQHMQSFFKKFSISVKNYYHNTVHSEWVECSPIVMEDLGSIPGHVYQRLRKWYLIPPCLTLSNTRYVSRLKWRNPGKGVAPSPTPRCSSYWKGSILVALVYVRQYLFWDSFEWFCLKICIGTE